MAGGSGGDDEVTAMTKQSARWGGLSSPSAQTKLPGWMAWVAFPAGA